MAAKANLIMSNDIQVTAREIDFVTRFERNWEHLREILGIMRPIKKQPGAVLKSKYAEGTLQDGNVKEGEEIPYSKFVVKEKPYAYFDLRTAPGVFLIGRMIPRISRKCSQFLSNLVTKSISRAVT